MLEKATGYLLLVIGLAVIVLSGISVYNVFTKISKPVTLFQFQGISLNPQQLFLNQNNNQLIQGLEGPKSEIISADLLNDTSNIFAHYLLMGFLVSIGAKIAGLGVMLLRPVEVKVRTKETPIYPQPPAPIVS